MNLIVIFLKNLYVIMSIELVKNFFTYILKKFFYFTFLRYLFRSIGLKILNYSGTFKMRQLKDNTNKIIFKQRFMSERLAKDTIKHKNFIMKPYNCQSFFLYLFYLINNSVYNTIT
ncbi:hypothetical protein EDEG_01863 [Edhazardia aedis USNM 41457]|uniref:Uncharacterized protein n=1 Tax=Edhazardia aedis (strain USNM 41457) TaxID=1003232 RepID=J9D8L9_EDHAE|nr:hypothetical protein EDEG_01863 [Edhazardia aedis USNM 41457]|eukprot:EJW03864.1 hypothetical protein EDEG_01863 [Edhazardia aedis USNM 41457]